MSKYIWRPIWGWLWLRRWSESSAIWKVSGSMPQLLQSAFFSYECLGIKKKWLAWMCGWISFECPNGKVLLSIYLLFQRTWNSFFLHFYNFYIAWTSVCAPKFTFFRGTRTTCGVYLHLLLFIKTTSKVKLNQNKFKAIKNLSVWGVAWVR